MAYEHLGDAALDYHPCRYGKSKLLFRGPRSKTDGTHLAVLGGTETYGKFVEKPYPRLLENVLRRPVANLGCPNAGTDAFLNDEAVLDVCRSAKLTVIEVLGAQNMSNRFYAVHPRRNDRFLRASSLLATVFREIDFTEFNFTRHMLTALADTSPEKFEMVRQELREAWLTRMRALIGTIGGPVVLLWMAGHAPEDESADPLGPDPLFVDRALLEQLRALVVDVIEIVAKPAEIEKGYAEMRFTDLEAPMAREMLGPLIQARAAEGLSDRIAPLL